MDSQVKMVIETEDTEIKVLIDYEVKKWREKNPRSYYQLRGKPVTKEQALDIISMTDRTFNSRKHFSDKVLPAPDFVNDWFSREPYGWVRPDGFIGVNDIICSCVSISSASFIQTGDLIYEWVNMLIKAPYLDLVIGITKWYEMPAEHCKQIYSNRNTSGSDWYEKELELEENLTYEKVRNFYDSLSAGVWVHDNTVEIMSPERTAKVYREYESLYEKDRHDIFSKYYFRNKAGYTAELDYLKKCVKHMGYSDPDAVIAESMKKFEIKHLKGFKGEVTDDEWLEWIDRHIIVVL